MTPSKSRFELRPETGVARNNEIASIKFDFPDPFGPMRMFRFSNSKVTGSGPNDSKFVSVIRRSKGSWVFGTISKPIIRAPMRYPA